MEVSDPFSPYSSGRESSTNFWKEQYLTDLFWILLWERFVSIYLFFYLRCSYLTIVFIYIFFYDSNFLILNLTGWPIILSFFLSFFFSWEPEVNGGKEFILSLKCVFLSDLLESKCQKNPCISSIGNHGRRKFDVWIWTNKISFMLNRLDTAYQSTSLKIHMHHLRWELWQPKIISWAFWDVTKHNCFFFCMLTDGL